MRLGKTDVARAPQMQDPNARRNRSLNPGALPVVPCEGWLRFTGPSSFERLVFLSRSEREKAPGTAGALPL
jgi:hypothetical protein